MAGGCFDIKSAVAALGRELFNVHYRREHIWYLSQKLSAVAKSSYLKMGISLVLVGEVSIFQSASEQGVMTKTKHSFHKN